ncbi:unnamed protein product [Rotaria sp. Silwood1]|nr:unnamed protein product [Rotaria sp. Silwood1]
MTNISIRQRTIVDKSANERIHRLKSVSRDSFIYFLVVCFAALCILDSYNHLQLDEDGDQFYEYPSNISSLKSNLMDLLKISQDYLATTLSSLYTFKYYSNESL